MEVLKFTETVMKNSGKKGILTPDSDGYYEMMVGALNVYNSASEFYTAGEVVHLFNSSSNFQRRVKTGALYAELGHPEREPGMSNEDFYRRMNTIKESNQCAHFSEVWLDFDYGKKHPELNSPEMIGIIAKLKPAGVKALDVELAINNPKQNCAFSIRGITENKYRNGRVERTLTTVVTFDKVTEPGISVADKVMAPGLESRVIEGLNVIEVIDTVIDKKALRNMLTTSLTNNALESSQRAMFTDIIRVLDNPARKNILASW